MCNAGTKHIGIGHFINILQPTCIKLWPERNMKSYSADQYVQERAMYRQNKILLDKQSNICSGKKESS